MAAANVKSAKRATKAGPGPEASEEVPKGYKPLTVAQKVEWNNFLRFLHRKGYYGQKELDLGDDKTQQLMDMYRQENPNFSITTQQVPYVQYEIRQLQKGKIPDPEGNFVDISGSSFGKIIPTIYNGKELSPVDGRVGSLTSTQAYPIAFSREMNKNWGTDYWGFINAMKSRENTTSNNSAPAAKKAMASTR